MHEDLNQNKASQIKQSHPSLLILVDFSTGSDQRVQDSYARPRMSPSELKIREQTQLLGGLNGFVSSPL